MRAEDRQQINDLKRQRRQAIRSGDIEAASELKSELVELFGIATLPEPIRQQLDEQPTPLQAAQADAEDETGLGGATSVDAAEQYRRRMRQ